MTACRSPESLTTKSSICWKSKTRATQDRTRPWRNLKRQGWRRASVRRVAFDVRLLRGLPPVMCELGQHGLHFRIGKNLRLADLQRTPVHLGERLDFDGQRERLVQRFADDDHPMVREQARFPSVERGERGVGKLLCTKCSVRRAADVVAARHRDHVMERRYAAVEAGERRGERRMRVDDRRRLRPRAIDVAVEPPFARRLARAARNPALVHRDDVVRRRIGVR